MSSIQSLLRHKARMTRQRITKIRDLARKAAREAAREAKGAFKNKKSPS